MEPARGRVLIATAAVAVFATVSAYAATPTRARVGTQVVDKTYSCRVARKHPVLLSAAVRSASAEKPRPAVATVTTVRKVVSRSGQQQVATQLGFEDVKNSLKVDKSVCSPSSRRIALKPAGLSLDQTMTQNFAGFMSVGCPARANRVLVRLRISLKGGAPQQARLIVRQEGAKRRSLAFLNWSPRRITDYLANDCGPG